MRSTTVNYRHEQCTVHCPSVGSACKQFIEFNLTDIDRIECPNCGIIFGLTNPRSSTRFNATVVTHREQQRTPEDQMRFAE